MIQKIVSFGKFFVKVSCVARFRALLLFLFPGPVSKDGWENRMLLVNLEGLGDIAVLTSALPCLRKAFPGRRVYLLVRGNIGIGKGELAGLVDEVIPVNYRAFVKNPFYGFSFIRRLRGIGFQTAVSFDPSIAEVSGKIITASVGAEEVVCYEGPSIQLENPFDPNMKMNIGYVRKNIFPRYTKVVPSIDARLPSRPRLLNTIRHYEAIAEAVMSAPCALAPTTLSVDKGAEKSVLKILQEKGIAPGAYGLLSLGTSTPHREWGAERFARVTKKLAERGVPIILVGAPGEEKLGQKFSATFNLPFVDLIGKTSVAEVVALAKHSLFSFSNDTAAVHIAIALRKPSLAVLGLGHFGMISLYGYSDINKWVYAKDADCLCDNWKCIFTVGPRDPAPCIRKISEDAVSSAALSLIKCLQRNPGYPHAPFAIDIPNE